MDFKIKQWVRQKTWIETPAHPWPICRVWRPLCGGEMMSVQCKFGTDNVGNQIVRCDNFEPAPPSMMFDHVIDYADDDKGGFLFYQSLVRITEEMHPNQCIEGYVTEGPNHNGFYCVECLGKERWWGVGDMELLWPSQWGTKSCSVK